MDPRLRDEVRSLPPSSPSAESRARIWARLEAPRRGWNARPAFALAAVLVVAAIAVVWARARPPREVSRPATFVWRDVGGRAQPSALRDGEWVEARAEELVVTQRGQLAARLTRGSRMRLEGHGRVLRLQRGELHVWDDAGARGSPLEIRTQTRRTLVVGTRFTVRTSGARDAFSVFEGRIEVIGPDESRVTLRRGDSLAIGWLETTPEPPEAKAWLARVGRAGRIDEPPPRPFATQVPTPAHQSIAATPSAPVARSALRTEEVTGPRRANAASQPRITVDEIEPAPPPAVPAAAMDELFAQPGEETEQERSVELALYRDGRRALRDGNAAAALDALRESRRRFAAGALRQEVDLSILDALVRLDRRAEAAREARAFLLRYPASERRAEVERIVRALEIE